jgi:hypothetical protein
MGVDSSGAAYSVWIEGNQILFATDRTGQWSSPELAYTIRYVTMDIDGAKGLAVGPNGVCHLFVQDGDPEATNYDVWHVVYDNGWGNAEDISYTPEPSDAPTGAVNPVDGSVICGWYDSTIHMWDIFLRYRSPAGNWGNIGILESGYYADYRPEFVFDASGRAHIVWYKRAFGSSKVMYSRNNDPSNSSGWSSPIEVKSETGEDWAFSKVDCDDAGNVYVVWVDASTGRRQKSTSPTPAAVPRIPISASTTPRGLSS